MCGREICLSRRRGLRARWSEVTISERDNFDTFMTAELRQIVEGVADKLLESRLDESRFVEVIETPAELVRSGREHPGS